MDRRFLFSYKRSMRWTLLPFCFLFFGGLLFENSTAYAQNNLTQKLLDYKPPLKPTRKPEPPKTGEISARDMKVYEHIFDLQKQAKWKPADVLMQNLQDQRLKGYVLRDRYLHPTGYTSTYSELKKWLEEYNDHAGADRIYRLAVKKGADEGALELTSPKEVETVHRYIDTTRKSKGLYSDGTPRSFAQKEAFLQLTDQILEKTRDERPTQALQILEAEKNRLTNLDYNRLRAKIAASYMHEGKLSKGFDLAKSSVDSAGQKVPLAAWVAGLTSWRKADYENAAKYFEIAASSTYANSWTVSGGAFWASRAHMRMGNFKAVSLWLNRAASQPRTFYGLVAMRALSRKLDFDWIIDPLSTAQRTMLAKNDAAARGLALAKLGRLEDAEHEFMFVEKTEDPEIRRAIISVADNIRSAGMTWRGASYLLMQEHDNVPLAAQYPVMRWESKGKYKIEPALLHAIIRQESRFNPKAGNPSGASGLMQLLPSTGRGIMGAEVFDAAGDNALFDPEFNIRAGQKYTHELFKRYVSNKNMFDLLIAWNAGPGNLQRWKKHLKNIDDPLLFIETIPVAETRAFVERVMTNYWLYQDRFELKTPSLDAVAEGKWPIYTYQ